uniref:Cilia and flagella associated protein 69 n=1 Tax=Serinus canaria TaxID=9135 RepID=A0A8C9NCZ2_SERCA
KTLKKVVKHFENGFPLEDLAQISEILNLCAEKIFEQEAFIEPLCFLMNLPRSQVKIQICKTIVSFFNMDLPGKLLSGYQPTSPNYKIQMAETGGIAEYLVYSLALVENQLTEKLWVLKALQHLSTSGYCGQMVKAQAASRLCLCLSDADPSGQLLFHSSDILWNLLEKASKEEVIYQLRSLECVHALKEAFVDLMCGYRHCDHQLRNDLLVIATLIAEYSAVPVIESGFAEILIVLATCTEVKLPNPLVKGFKLTYSYEDFEMKKLLFNIIGILSKDTSSAQLLTENHVIPALLYYVKKNPKPGFPGWSVAQYEELQLHAIAVLASVAPLLLDKYLSCQGNTLLLVFLEWCVSQDPFFGRGNSFHGTGGRGTKHAQLCYGIRVLRSVVALYNDAVTTNLCDQGAISQLLGKAQFVLLFFNYCEGISILIPFLKMDTRSFYCRLGYSYLLFSALDCLSCVIGCYIAEDSFIEKQGIFLLMDLLALQEKNLSNLILGLLVEFSDNAQTILHMNIWRGKRGQTAAKVLIQLWRQEEMDLGVKRDQYGKIVDFKRPVITSFQKQQKVIPVPASCPSISIIEISESLRAKIYSIFCKLGFEYLPGLSAKDVVTLAIIQHFIDFKVGEVWSEISAEIKEEFRPVTADERALKLISEMSENTGKMVAALQTEALGKQHRKKIQEEKKTYQKIKATHTQKEMINKSWENFLARTSNYEELKVRNLMKQEIDNFKQCIYFVFQVTPGRCVTVGSVPHQGEPLADTDHAPKKSSAGKKAFRSDQKR